MNKYYATITIKVLMQADSRDEAQEALDYMTVHAVGGAPYTVEVDILDTEVKITDVK